MRRGRNLFWIILFAAAGCHSLGGSAALPTYSAMNGQTARAILAGRADALHSLTAQCEVTLDRGDGHAVRLDAALVMEPPNLIRMRAWKLGQAVFDLTLRPDGLWIEVPPEASKHGEVIPATLNAAQVSRQLTWITGGFFSAMDLKTSGNLTFSRILSDGTTAVCDVDPATVTARRFSLLDSTGAVRFTLDLAAYRNFDGIIWPTHLTATELAHDGDKGGHIDILFEDVEFNTELAGQAFVPPPTAKRQP